MQTINDALNQSDLNDILNQLNPKPEESRLEDFLEGPSENTGEISALEDFLAPPVNTVSEETAGLRGHFEDSDQQEDSEDKELLRHLAKAIQDLEIDSGESYDSEEEESEEEESEEVEKVEKVLPETEVEKVALPESGEVEKIEDIEDSEDTLGTVLISLFCVAFVVLVLGGIIFLYPTYTSRCCFSFNNLSFCKFSDHCEKHLRVLNYNLPETVLQLCCYHVAPYSNSSNTTLLCLRSCLEEGQLALY